jgi:hypothetical protein
LIVKEVSVRRMRAALVMALLALPPGAGIASAQDQPTLDLSGGYMLLRFAGDTLPIGWYADASRNVSRLVAIAVDGSGTYKSETLDLAEPAGEAPFRVHSVAHLRLHGVAAGPRVTASHGRVRPFAQLLAGTIRTSNAARVTINGAFRPELSDVLSRGVFRFAIQPGAGVSIFLSDRIGARVAVDYRRITFASDEVSDVNEIRFAAGVVVAIGRK